MLIKINRESSVSNTPKWYSALGVKKVCEELLHNQTSQSQQSAF